MANRNWTQSIQLLYQLILIKCSNVTDCETIFSTLRVKPRLILARQEKEDLERSMRKLWCLERISDGSAEIYNPLTDGLTFVPISFSKLDQRLNELNL